MVGLALLTTVLAGVQEAMEDYHEKMAEKIRAAQIADGTASADDEPTKHRRPKGILGVLGGGAIDMSNDNEIDAANEKEAAAVKPEKEKKKKKK